MKATHSSPTTCLRGRSEEGDREGQYREVNMLERSFNILFCWGKKSEGDPKIIFQKNPTGNTSFDFVFFAEILQKVLNDSRLGQWNA